MDIMRRFERRDPGSNPGGGTMIRSVTGARQPFKLAARDRNPSDHPVCVSQLAEELGRELSNVRVRIPR